jgi:hypothetical protein
MEFRERNAKRTQFFVMDVRVTPAGTTDVTDPYSGGEV